MKMHATNLASPTQETAGRIAKASVAVGAARAGAGLVGFLLAGVALAGVPVGPTAPASVQHEELRRHVEYLASDALEGRFTGSEGAEKAAAYIVDELERLGVQPLPGHDGLRHEFEFTAGVDDAGSSLTLDGSVPGAGTFEGADDVQALSFSDSAEVTGEVVFAGYGLVVPESQGYEYDNYATLDVTDKIVIVLRYVPEDVDQEARAILSRYSGLRYKAMMARERGAKALVVVTGPRSPNAGTTVPMSDDTALSGSGIVAASISGRVAEPILAAVPGMTLEQAQAGFDDGNPHVAGFAVPEVRLTLDVKVARERRVGHNVVGFFPATESPAGDKPWIVLGAHYDHLGHGGHGNSLADAAEADQIHNGADDNASGVAALLEVAEQLATIERHRNVALAFWSGEEIGTLGSADFVNEQPIPMEEVAAYINLDMVGRVRNNTLIVQAAGSSPVWPRLIEQTNVPIGFDLQVQEDPYLPTDSLQFNTAGVPTLSLFTGSHQQYHKPSDDAETINYEDLARVARFGALLAGRVADLDEAPAFVMVERAADAGGDRDSVRAFTGTIPDYASDVEGLLLGGVIEGGPAAEAGLQKGDVIVEFAGQQITNIYDYTYALDAVKIDVPVAVIYLRDGERHETTLTPRARR